MRAYELIKCNTTEHDFDFFNIYPKLCSVKGVINVDKVFGCWDYILKIDGKSEGDIERIRNDIIKCGCIRDINTVIIFSEK